MWNEFRSDSLKSDVYRATESVEVFKKIGFVVSGSGRISNMMSYSDESKGFEDFMIDNRNVAVVAKSIYDILTKIHLSPAFFDFMYENL